VTFPFQPPPSKPKKWPVFYPSRVPLVAEVTIPCCVKRASWRTTTASLRTPYAWCAPTSPAPRGRSAWPSSGRWMTMSWFRRWSWGWVKLPIIIYYILYIIYYILYIIYYMLYIIYYILYIIIIIFCVIDYYWLLLLLPYDWGNRHPFISYDLG